MGESSIVPRSSNWAYGTKHGVYGSISPCDIADGAGSKDRNVMILDLLCSLLSAPLFTSPKPTLEMVVLLADPPFNRSLP